MDHLHALHDQHVVLHLVLRRVGTQVANHVTHHPHRIDQRRHQRYAEVHVRLLALAQRYHVVLHHQQTATHQRLDRGRRLHVVERDVRADDATHQIHHRHRGHQRDGAVMGLLLQHGEDVQHDSVREEVVNALVAVVVHRDHVVRVRLRADHLAVALHQLRERVHELMENGQRPARVALERAHGVQPAAEVVDANRHLGLAHPLIRGELHQRGGRQTRRRHHTVVAHRTTHVRAHVLHLVAHVQRGILRLHLLQQLLQRERRAQRDERVAAVRAEDRVRVLQQTHQRLLLLLSAHHVLHVAVDIGTVLVVHRNRDDAHVLQATRLHRLQHHVEKAVLGRENRAVT